MTFDEIIQKLSEDSLTKTAREQGSRFEKIIKQILQIVPQFSTRFKEVYLWSEFSDKFGIAKGDSGIDIMAMEHSGEWVSIQCKCYKPTHSLSLGELKNFLGIRTIFNSQNEIFCHISQHLLFHTCQSVSKEIENALLQTQSSETLPGKAYGYYDLLNLGIDWKNVDLDNPSSLHKSTKKQLRPHQKEALESIKRHFLVESNTRGKVIMACGTGKSLLSIRTLDSLMQGGEIALFLAPSLALINQMICEFFKESELAEEYKVFAVCSDGKVGSNHTRKVAKDSEDMSANELTLPPLTDKYRLAQAIHTLFTPPPPIDVPHSLDSHISHLKPCTHTKSSLDSQSQALQKPRIVIFSTYQSIDVIIEAQEIFKLPFKIIINDEAHRTAGVQKLDENENVKEISVWQKTHDNSLLNAAYRLYLTATPRIYSSAAKNNLKEKSKGKELLLFSMDDEELFGKEIYRLPFYQAIQAGLLSDYRVVISYMREEAIADYLAKLTKAQENSKLNVENAGKMVGFAKAIRKENLCFVSENGLKEAFSDDTTPMKRAVAFHSKIGNSKFYTDNFGIIDREIELRHIDGGDNAYQKSEKLSWLAEDTESTSRVLSNAKCLTEGIDVPNLDAVCFFDKRDSIVDIVQAVGRAIRKSEGKKYGYIILPLVLSDEDIKDYDKALKGDKFKIVWDTLKALRSHDERLIDEARINEVVSIITDHMPPKDEPEVSLFSIQELFSEMKNAIPKNLGDLQYWEHYASKVGDIMHALTLRITALTQSNSSIQALFTHFVKALRGNLNSSFDEKDAIALIAQHIITKPIFECIFPTLNFATFDKVSAELEKLYTELLGYGLDSETKELEKFYTSVRSNAEFARSDKSKQELIKNLYDTLFKNAFKKTQEKLGIVYTPIEGVDFIIHSVEYALKKHFNKSLGDENIHIYDPFTGTGTFLTRLIQSGYLDLNLQEKYKKELWANEITLLGYYIAQINITTAYHERLLALQKSASESTKQNFELLDNLLFTDTFNTYTPESKGFKGKNTTKGSLFESNYFKRNYEKIQELKNAPFKVIICNPPYSAGQKSGNDNNKNQKYEYLDARIANTYVAKMRGQKFKYDSYKLAIRYASDRIENSGVIGMITNGSFIEGNADSGLRACLEEEFDYIYIFNLRGDINKSKQNKNSGEGQNFFGNSSGTPIAISIFVKDENAQQEKAQIVYCDIGDYLSTQDKRNILQNLKSIEGIESATISHRWSKITPNKDYDWINQRDYSFMAFMPIANKKLKGISLSKITHIKNQSRLDSEVLKSGYIDIFELFSMGVVSNRDSWVYNFSKEKLEKNMRFMIENYNHEVEALERDSDYIRSIDSTKIKWTRDLEKSLTKKLKFDFNESGLIVSTHYRPFTKCHLYLAKHFNEMLCQMPQIYPAMQTESVEILECDVEYGEYAKAFYKSHKYLPNIAICIDEGGNLGALMTNLIPDLHLFAQTQCFPLYYYEKVDSESLSADLFTESTRQSTQGSTAYYRRKDSIRDEALAKFQEVYKDSSITKEDIFYYIYALLNHSEYKARFGDNLSKMLPRIPFMRDFRGFERGGRELARVHLSYEGLESKKAFASLRAKLDSVKSALKGNLFHINYKEESRADIANLDERDFYVSKIRFATKGMGDIIFFNDKIAIVNIPESAYAYKVNGKSAIEWIIDRYQIKVDKESHIENNPNLYECQDGALKGLKGGKYILNLLLSIIEMSCKSVEILSSLPPYELLEEI